MDVVKKGLSEFFTSTMKSLLHSLKIDFSFLDSDPEVWVNTEAYARRKVRISTQMVTNDAAELSVALIQFTNNGRTEQDQLQGMVQVVEEHKRRHLKTANKRALVRVNRRTTPSAYLSSTTVFCERQLRGIASRCCFSVSRVGLVCPCAV